MSHLQEHPYTLPVLGKITGISRRHLQRMAIDGRIPGAERTLGGHWRVKRSVELDGWIARVSLPLLIRSNSRLMDEALRTSIMDVLDRIGAFRAKGVKKGRVSFNAFLPILLKILAEDALQLAAEIKD